MKNALLVIAGIGVGFVVAHQVANTAKGKQFFDDVNHRAHDFGDAIVDGYKQREAELRAAIADAGETLDQR